MKYTDTHEWIRAEEKIGTVGVTDHAQKELGDIVYVELPEVGKKVKAGEEAAVLESTKAAADVYAPVSGTIVEVNEQLGENSQLVNSSAEDMGWLFRIEMSDPAELDNLMDHEHYTAQLS